MIYAHTTIGQTNTSRVTRRRPTPGTWHVARPTSPTVANPPVEAAKAAPANKALSNSAINHRTASLFLAIAVTACIFAAVLGAFDGAAQRGSEVSARNAAVEPAISTQTTPEPPLAAVKELRTIELPTVVIVGKRL